MNKRTFLISEEDERFIIERTLEMMQGGILGHLYKETKAEDYELQLEFKIESDGEFAMGIRLTPKNLLPEKLMMTCHYETN